jgi:hypothetical protein
MEIANRGCPRGASRSPVLETTFLPESDFAADYLKTRNYARNYAYTIDVSLFAKYYE